jgi:hypothetical protein
MWNKIKSPVLLMLFSIVIVIADRILDMFFNYYLVYFGIHVVWVAPILFIIGVIWLIISLIKK